MIYDNSVSGKLDQGDIVKLKIKEWIPWWSDESVHPVVILTPTCDLEHDKANHHRFTVLQPFQLIFLAFCSKAMIYPNDAISKSKYKDLKGKVEKLVSNNEFPRYYFFPKKAEILSIDRVADFEIIGSAPIASFSIGDRIARLKSPFKEQFIHRFAHHGMRIGTEDLPRDLINGTVNECFSSNKITINPE